METVISIVGIIVVGCLILITSSIVSITNTLWDILQEIKKKSDGI